MVINGVRLINLIKKLLLDYYFVSGACMHETVGAYRIVEDDESAKHPCVPGGELRIAMSSRIISITRTCSIPTASRACSYSTAAAINCARTRFISGHLNVLRGSGAAMIATKSAI